MVQSAPYQRGTAEQAVNTLQAKVVQAGEQLKDGAEQAVDAVSKHGAKAVAKAQDAAEDGYAATKKFVRDQPFVALGGIAVISFALGALWKISPQRRGIGYDALDRVSSYLEPQYRALRRYW